MSGWVSQAPAPLGQNTGQSSTQIHCDKYKVSTHSVKVEHIQTESMANIK